MRKFKLLLLLFFPLVALGQSSYKIPGDTVSVLKQFKLPSYNTPGFLKVDNQGHVTSGTVTESDPLVPAYSKSLTNFSVIKTATDALYQVKGSYQPLGNYTYTAGYGMLVSGNVFSVDDGKLSLKQGYFINQTLHTLRVINYTDNTKTTILSQIDVLSGQTVNSSFLSQNNVAIITNVGAAFHDDIHYSFDYGVSWAIGNNNNNQYTGSTIGLSGQLWILVTEVGVARVLPNINQNYQPLGSYVATETDPLVPVYAKSLTGFSIIKTSTDALYQPLGSYLTLSNQVNRAIPSGAVDGSNTVFTVADTPVTGTDMVYKNGQLLTYTTDYTLSGAAITFVIAPLAGSLIRVSYSR